MSCVRNSCICFRSHASRALHEGLPQTLMMGALIGEAYLFVDRIFADNDFCRHGICRILEIIDLQELPLKFFVRHNNLVGSVVSSSHKTSQPNRFFESHFFFLPLPVGLNPCFTASATRSKLSRFFSDSKVLTRPSDIRSLFLPIFTELLRRRRHIKRNRVLYSISISSKNESTT